MKPYCTRFRLLLTFMLTLVSTSAMAEWTKVSDIDEFTQYADTSTIQKKGNKVKMWELEDLKSEHEIDGLRYLSTKSQEEYDCKEVKARTIALIHMSKRMGKGNVVYSYDDKPARWISLPPYSMLIELWKIACGKK